VNAVSKATGLAERTVYNKVKQAREELEANGGEQAGDSGKEEGALKSPKKKSPTKKSPTKKVVKKEETPETDADFGKKSPAKKKSPVKKAVKKEEEENEEIAEPDAVESPRQTRSGGVKRKNYADLNAGDESQVEDAAGVEKSGRAGQKMSKRVKTEEEDGGFEAGADGEKGETGNGDVEGEKECKDVEKEAEGAKDAVKDEEA